MKNIFGIFYERIFKNSRNIKKVALAVFAPLSVMAVALIFALSSQVAFMDTVPACGYEEHVHGSECYRNISVTGTSTDIGTPTEIEPVNILICGLEEHTHTSDCYPVIAMSRSGGATRGAGIDVADKIELTDLIVKHNNNIVYDHNGTFNSDYNVEIGDTCTLSFSLNWEVIDPEAYNFQNGDYFEIPIMTASGFTAFPPQSYPLVVGSVHVATGYFVVVDKGDGTWTLSFRVTFNANASSMTITHGFANGEAKVTLIKDSSVRYLIFEDDGNFTITFSKEPPPSSGPPYITGVGIPGWDMTYPYNPRYPESLDKYAETSASDGSMIGNLDNFYNAVPARDVLGDLIMPLDSSGSGTSGEKFQSFEWWAPFWGMLDYYKETTNRGTPTSGYVVFEDTISSNMEFSTFNAYNKGFSLYNRAAFFGQNNNTAPTRYGSSNIKISPILNPGKTIENDFFSVPLLHRSLDGQYFRYASGGHIEYYYDGIRATNAFDFNNNSTMVYAPQSQFLQICESALDPTYNIYSSPAAVKTNVNSQSYATAKDAVIATPMSYCVVRNPDGTKTLVVNAGKMGQNIPANEGIAASDLFVNYFYDSPPTDMYETARRLYLDRMMNRQDIIAKIIAGIDTPETRVLQVLEIMKADLQQYAPGSAKANLFSNGVMTVSTGGSTGYYEYGFANLTAYTTAYDAAWAQFATYEANVKAYIQAVNGGATYIFDGDKRIMNGTAPNSSSYPELVDFYKYIIGIHSEKGTLGEAFGLTGIYGLLPYGTPDDLARCYAIRNTYFAVSQFEGYWLRNYFLYVMDLDAVVEGHIKSRDGLLDSMLFHFPQMREVLALQMGMTNTNPTNAELIDALFGDNSWGKYQALVRTPTYPIVFENGVFGYYEGGTFKPSSDINGYGFGWKVTVFEGASDGGSGDNRLWHFASGVQSYAATHPLTELGISGIGLTYRTIMVDASKPTIANSMKVSVGVDMYEVDKDMHYIYRYGAGIFATDKGGAMFAKADADANGKTEGWLTAANPETLYGLKGKLGGAKFKIYPTETDMINDTNAVKFANGSDTNTYVYDTSGSITEITTNSDGVFYLYGFPTAEAEFWIKETAAPAKYKAFATGRSFTVKATGGNPNCYVLYNEKEIELTTEWEFDIVKHVDCSDESIDLNDMMKNEEFTIYFYEIDDIEIEIQGGFREYISKLVVGDKIGEKTFDKDNVRYQGEGTGKETVKVTGLTEGTYYYLAYEDQTGSGNGWHHDQTVYIIKLDVAGDRTISVEYKYLWGDVVNYLPNFPDPIPAEIDCGLSSFYGRENLDIIFENYYQTYGFAFRKYSERTLKDLSGIEFGLYRQNNSGPTRPENATSFGTATVINKQGEMYFDIQLPSDPGWYFFASIEGGEWWYSFGMNIDEYGDIAWIKGNITVDAGGFTYKLPEVYNEDNVIVLEGAEFTMYLENPDENPAAVPFKTVITDDTGYARFSSLMPGIYYMKETIAPDGYILPEDIIYKIIIDEDAANRIVMQTIKGGVKIDEIAEDGKLLSIYNKKAGGPKLPETGGMAIPFTAIGLVIAMIAVGAFAYFQKKRSCAKREIR